MKPYSEACDQNKVPILKVLREVFKDRRTVLEIGSGTGQHAVYFGSQLSHLIWQPSDLAGHHAGIMMWLDEYRLPNVHPPIRLDVDDEHWPEQRFDAVFSANTAHILSWPQVERMFAGVGSALQDNGVFALYGPFNYRGCYTSDSNVRFDQWLKAREPSSGIRDFEALDSLAHAQDMILLKDYEMPVNNRTLVWRKLRQTGG
ncbi:MAG: DUF938 domain-containing protein [Gammaproteobacteria bacterium]|nr:DUF938 domain-containing protein [Gammaproteobacteria bacterium]